MIVGGITTADIEAFGMQTQPQVWSRHRTCITIRLCLQQVTTIPSSGNLKPEHDISETNMYMLSTLQAMRNLQTASVAFGQHKYTLLANKGTCA